MKAFVTGATGFLGSHLCRRLKGEGWNVLAHGRNAHLKARLESEGIAVAQGDLTNENDVRAAVRGCDRVFHVAGLSSPWGSPEDFFRSNVLTTRAIVDACLSEGVGRLVFTSSPSIYIDGKHQLDLREDAPIPSRFINDYARTKYLAEEEVRRGAAHGLSTVVLRPQALVGAGDRAILPRLIAANRKSGVPLFDGGRCLMDLTHIDNVVLAHFLAATADLRSRVECTTSLTEHRGQCLRILKVVFQELGEPLRTRELPFPLVHALAGLSEFLHRTVIRRREPTLTRYGVVVLARSRTLDISAARADLGYDPAASVEDGLREFVKEWKINGA